MRGHLSKVGLLEQLKREYEIELKNIEVIEEDWLGKPNGLLLQVMWEKGELMEE